MSTTSSSGRSCSQGRGDALAQAGLGVGADDEGDQLSPGRQQPVEHLAGRGRDVGAQEGDVAVDDAEHVARVAHAGPGQRLLRRDRDRAVPGRDRGPGHRDDVGVHRPGGVEHREGGQGLHRGAGRHDVGVDAGAGRRLDGDLGGHEGVAVTREQHDGGRPGRLHGLEQLAGRRSAPGTGGDDDRAGLAQQRADAGPGRAGDDGQRGRLVAGPDLGGEVGDPDPLGATRGDAGLDGGARVVDVHVHVPQVGSADDEQRVTQAVEGAGERVDGVVAGVGEQVHHLVGRAVAVRLAEPVERVVPGQGR